MITQNIFTLILLVLFYKLSYSQPYVYEFPSLPTPNINPGELLIINQTKYAVDNLGLSAPFSFIVRIYPKGAIFNGYKNYTPLGISRNTSTNENFYLCGGDAEIPFFGSSGSHSIKINFDDAPSSLPGPIVGGPGQCTFNIVFGLYVIEFWHSAGNGEIDFGQPMINSFEMDWRNANFRGYNYIGNGQQEPLLDIRIDFLKPDLITFKHYPTQPIYFQDIRNVDKFIKMWDLYGVPDTLDRIPYSKGMFFDDSSFVSYPIDGTKYYTAGNPWNPAKHLSAGYLGLNLVLSHNIVTQDTALGDGEILTARNGYLKIADGIIFNMTPPLVGHHNLIVQDSSLLWLDANSHLYVGAGNRLTLKSTGTIKLGYNSEIIFKAGSLFCNEGGRIIAHEVNTIAGWGKIVFENGFHQINCAQILDFAFSDSVKLVLEDSSTLEIPDSTILHFSGSQSGLIMKPNSKLKLGVGCKVLFDSGASIFANGATFTSIDSTLKWDGIVLSNSDADTVTNCTFSNAVTALTFTNNSNSAYKNRIITNNTFNIPSWGVNKGIYGENNYKILIKNNVFNMPVYFPSSSTVPLIYVGVYLKNNSTLEAAGGDIEEDQSSNYSLNIIENTFSNGCASVILANYTSNYLPYLISDNTFNNTASANIIGMKISGTIRDNNFTSDDVPLGIHLINNNPNLYKNTINSRDVGLHLAGHCYPNLAPYVSGENLVWTGGNNYFTTTDIDNIQLSSSGYVSTDFGNNNFTINNSSSYHIYGWLDSTHNIYYARDNCWNGSAQSRIYLKTYGSSDTVPVPVINTNNYNCSGEINPSGWNVSYNGNGVYDSIKLSDDNTGEQPSEVDILYAQAVSDLSNGLPVQAIIDFKYLTDNYPEYEDLPKILYEFYSCYQMLDTNEGQNYRQPLYQDIVDYLNEKLLSDNFTKNSDFIDNAFDIILMAESIINLNSAAGGYEFLAFNHPDPDIRLTASWNYNEIQELINSGNGGGNQFQITNDKFQIEDQNQLKEHNELIRLNELISDDPVMSKMKRSFEKTSNERNERIDKQLSRESTNGEIVREKIKRSRQIDIQKEDRAKRNIFDLRNMSKEEKEMRRMEDMALTTLDIRNEFKNDVKVSVPLHYKLEQNYPNPFNPVTDLEFGISNLGFVSLKIYDVLGKEIKTLVNEIRQPGIYKVEFDGSNLASGIYFYTFEAGSFKQTKRMLLLK